MQIGERDSPEHQLFPGETHAKSRVEKRLSLEGNELELQHLARKVDTKS